MDRQRLAALKAKIGRSFGVGLSDVGVWDVDGGLRAGFWDEGERRPRTFAAAELAPGEFTLYEEAAAPAAEA
jgi:hypothetical protein